MWISDMGCHIGDDVPQELALGDFEATFLRVQLNVESPKVVEGFFQVGDEATTLLRLHDDVVDINLQVAPYLPFEAELHTPLVSGPCVLPFERYFHIAEIVEGGDEHGSRLIWLDEGYLVITQVGI
jgi:hypothetical protein